MSSDGTQAAQPLETLNLEAPKTEKLRVVSDDKGGAVPVKGGSRPAPSLDWLFPAY